MKHARAGKVRMRAHHRTALDMTGATAGTSA